MPQSKRTKAMMRSIRLKDNTSLLKPHHKARLLDEEIIRGSYTKPIPQIKGLNGKPLPVSYSQDFHHNMIAEGREKSQGFLTKRQTGIPKLDKKMWYELQGYEDDPSVELIKIIQNKNDEWKPDGTGHWIREASGKYWQHEGDSAIRLIRGNLMTQDELTIAYNNAIDDKGYDRTDPPPEISPLADTVHICTNCGNHLRMSDDCSTCGTRHTGSGLYQAFN